SVSWLRRSGDSWRLNERPLRRPNESHAPPAVRANAECRAQALSRRSCCSRQAVPAIPGSLPTGVVRRSRRPPGPTPHEADARLDAHIRCKLRRLPLDETEHDLAKVVGRNLAGDLDSHRRPLPQRDAGGWCDRKTEEPCVTQDRVRDSRLDHDGLALALALEIEEFDEHPEHHQDAE